MVRAINENSPDWRTDTDDQDVNAARELMIHNNQYQDDPYVGIFWYDIESDDLFGVKETLAEDTDFYFSKLFNSYVRTCKPLHYKVWEKEYHRGKDKRFSGDYTKVPRGRVFEFKDKGFVVFVGSWITDYPSAKDLILDEFQLPDNTEFRVDSHWDLGHGWSDKFI